MNAMKPFLFALLLPALLALGGCKKHEVELLNTTVTLSPAFSVPALTGYAETGTCSLILTSENRLVFSLSVDSLAADDQLQIAHIHLGNPVENGDVLVDLVDGFKIAFNGATASGEITVTAAQAETILNDEVYVNVHSKKVPTGLLRGPVGKQLIWAQDIPLTANKPGRTETGLSTLRLTADGTLYSLLKVNNLAAGDNLQVAHIHRDSLVAGGDVLFDLCRGASEFGLPVEISLTAAQSTDFQTKPCYINCHSSQEPTGFLGAQIR